MNNSDAIRLVLDRYKFTAPLPGNIKPSVSFSKRKNLVKILRAQGKTGIFTLLAVWLYFGTKKMGYTLTLTKAYAAAALFAAGTAAVITAGSAFTVFTVYTKHTLKPQPASISMTPPSDPVRTEKPIVQQISYKLEIQPFFSAPDLSAVSSALTQAVKKKLSIEKKIPVFMTGTISYDAPAVLIGSITRLDGTYMINARLVDAATSKILILVSEKCGDDGIDTAAAAIAAKIADAL